MGGQPSQEDYFLLEELSHMQLKNYRQIEYFWLESEVSELHIKMVQGLRSRFKIDQVTSVKGLKNELTFFSGSQLVKVITNALLNDREYQELQDEKRVTQIIILNCEENCAKELKKRFNKVVIGGNSNGNLAALLSELESSDSLTIPLDSVLFLTENDTKSINRYKLNYRCLTGKVNKEQGKVDFLALAEKMYPDKKNEIELFRKEYLVDCTEETLQKQAIDWAFKDSFYWDLIETLPRTTKDPKRLAYLRLSFKNLYEAIFESYKVVEKRKFIESYLVVDLNEEEVGKLSGSKDNFIIFTSFVKGYTKSEEAKAVKALNSRPHAYMFTVMPNRKKCEESLNFGYIIKDGTIIYNIYNLFKVCEVESNIRRVTLTYGGLAEVFYKNTLEENRKNITANERALLRNYDYIEEMMCKIDSQAPLLQQSGYYTECIEVCDRKVNDLKKSNEEITTVGKYVLLKGDAYRLNEQYDKAEEAYRSVTSGKMRLLALVRLAELFLMRNQDEQQQVVLKELEMHKEELRQINEEDYFKFVNFQAIQLISKGKYGMAKKKLSKLIEELKIYYNYRFEGRPLVHEIYRNYATCESLMNHHEEALNLLNSTREWQINSEGKTANLALTETMIQAVNKSRGNNKDMLLSLQRLEDIRSHVMYDEVKYLNQSMVQISVGLEKEEEKEKEEKYEKVEKVEKVKKDGTNEVMNLNQSTVTIDL